MALLRPPCPQHVGQEQPCAGHQLGLVPAVREGLKTAALRRPLQ